MSTAGGGAFGKVPVSWNPPPPPPGLKEEGEAGMSCILDSGEWGEGGRGERGGGRGERERGGERGGGGGMGEERCGENGAKDGEGRGEGREKRERERERECGLGTFGKRFVERRDEEMVGPTQLSNLELASSLKKPLGLWL